jgi:hypothetical protein
MKALSVDNISGLMLSRARPRNLACAGRAVLAVGLCVLALAAMAAAAQPKVTVILRYDDYSTKSPTDMERKMVEILKKRHAKVVFAVTPFVAAKNTEIVCPQKELPLTPLKVSLLKDAVNAGVA